MFHWNVAEHAEATDINLPVGKVVCIGQNYAEHIKELNSTTSPDALFFMKPNTALTAFADEIEIPTAHGECHNELELAVLIAEPLKQASEASVAKSIWGYGLALDLTLRDVQKQLKALGRPWEVAKAFDGACPVSKLLPAASIADPQALQLTLTVNGEVRQQGSTQAMIRPVISLIQEMSQHFTLLPGDLILTGTPAGVGPLVPGDTVVASLESEGEQCLKATAHVIKANPPSAI